MWVWWWAGWWGKQRKDWLFSLWRKGLNQAERPQTCQGAQCSAAPQSPFSFRLTRAQMKSDRKSSKSWAFLLFSPPLTSLPLASTNNKLGPHYVPDSLEATAQSPTGKNKSAPTTIEWESTEIGEYTHILSYNNGFFNSFPSIAWHIFCLKKKFWHVILQEEGNIMNRIQAQMWAFLSRDSWAQG